MSRNISSFLAILVLVVGCIVAGAQDAGAAGRSKKDSSKFGTPLTVDELFQLYQGRTWLWDKGGGYFSPKERRFTAWTGTGYGDGRWFLTDPGKLCFRASWTAKGGSAQALTCFSHRKKGSNVYQRREPDGEWYLFKHSPARAVDEYAKVRRGNYVGARFKRLKARLPGKV